MRKSFCGMARAVRGVPPLRWATLLPALGVSLLTLFATTAQSQNAFPTGLTTLTPQNPQPPAVPPGTPKIGDIVIIGNKTLSPTYIIAAAGVKVGDPCVDATYDQIVTNLYKTGFFGRHSPNPEDAIRVKVEENNPSNGLCKVIIEVDENDTIHKVSITGSGPIKPEEIQKRLHVNLDTGSVYNENQFLADVIDIQNLYRSQGYQAVVTEGGPDPNNPGVLKVELLVARVAEIKITGNHRTKRRVILREMKTKEGDYYNINQLNRDRQRLFNLDLFEDIIPEERTIGPGRLGLTLSVVEKRTGTVSVGVGYSNRQQLVGRAEIYDTNFRGMAETMNLLWETGGVANRNSVELGFTEPWIDNRNTSLSTQIYDKTVYRFASGLFNNGVTSNTAVAGTDTRYFEQRTGGNVTLSRPFRQTYRAALNLRAENVRTDNLALDANNAQIIQNGPITVLGATLLHNTRDLDLDPISGGFQSLNLQFGHANLKPVKVTDFAGVVFTPTQAVSGSVNFSKLTVDMRQYISLQGRRPKNKLDAKKSAIALRAMLGTTVGQLPFFEQYFVGGAESLRGYREDRFWGRYMALGSVELRQPIANALTGVLFLDVGDAWGGPYQGVNIDNFSQPSGFHPHAGVGLGIRVRTPLGPLRLDYGIGSEGGRTHFSIGNVF